MAIVNEFDLKINNILDLGCGPGFEAGCLGLVLGKNVHGLEVDQKFHPWARPLATLENYNGRILPYSDSSFDAVYSYHVLEHVVDLDTLFGEVLRVLKGGGIAYFGVPNKSRMISAFGTPYQSLRFKIWQNIRDWKYRLMGKFDNRLGAHAGFDEKELEGLLKTHFEKVICVTDRYYYYKWPCLKSLFRFLGRLSIDRYVLPSVYFLCFKQKKRSELKELRVA
jgi:SAM-dependent methyltransferase